jgi:hypothetical protein
MKRRFAQFFLVILISLSIPLFSAYLDTYDLAEADFLACDISFESSDKDNLPIDRQNESEVFLPSAFLIRFPSEIDPPGQLPHFSFTTCPLDQKTCILRC